MTTIASGNSDVTVEAGGSVWSRSIAAGRFEASLASPCEKSRDSPVTFLDVKRVSTEVCVLLL